VVLAQDRHSLLNLNHPDQVNNLPIKDKEKQATYMRLWRRSQPEKTLLTLAKQRAKRDGIPFSITADDIKLVTKCPVLGIELTYGSSRQGNTSPSLDRIVPDKGYVPGNVAIMSMKANRLKSNGTLDEITKVYKWLKRQTLGSKARVV
jgi:hypothetical protein